MRQLLLLLSSPLLLLLLLLRAHLVLPRRQLQPREYSRQHLWVGRRRQAILFDSTARLLQVQRALVLCRLHAAAPDPDYRSSRVEDSRGSRAIAVLVAPS